MNPQAPSLLSARRVFWTLLFLAFTLGNLLHFIGEANPDWYSYQTLFEEQGAWLAERGRDPTFLGLMEFFALIGSYEAFRLWVGLYFLIFTFWILNRWARHVPELSVFATFLSLAPLLMPKFTVQIREGLAQTVVLAALTLLFEQHRRGPRAGLPLMPLLLLAVASTIHAATAVLVAAVLIPLAALRLGGAAGARLVLPIAVAMTLLAAAAGLYVIGVGDLLRDAASRLLGELQQEEARIDSAKAAYWSAKVIALGYLAVRVRRCDLGQTAFGLFTRYATYALAPTFLLLAVYLIFTGYPAFIASAAIRAYHTVFYVVFALHCLVSRPRAGTAAVAGLLLLDEYRVMTVDSAT